MMRFILKLSYIFFLIGSAQIAILLVVIKGVPLQVMA